MSMRYTVKKGDSLWSLAYQYQGSGTLYPKIVDHHNEEVARYGPNSGLLVIKDPNLIFIGQTLFLPPQARRAEEGAGKKFEASQLAVPVDLKINYVFGYEEVEPIIYVEETHDYVIKTQMRGKIGIELHTVNRHHLNFELLMAKNAEQCKYKLNDIYIPAFRALTKKPDMVLKGDQVIITPNSSAKETGLAPYMVSLSEKSGNHMQGKLNSQHSNGILNIEGKKYKFNNEIEFIVDVYLKQDKAVKLGQHKQDNFRANLQAQANQARASIFRYFGNKDNLKDIGYGFGEAGLVVTLTHSFVALKAYAIFDISTGGPVTTTTMVAAGTPTGQKILLEFIPSINPSTLPSPTIYGFFGWLTEHLIGKKVRHN